MAQHAEVSGAGEGAPPPASAVEGQSGTTAELGRRFAPQGGHVQPEEPEAKATAGGKRRGSSISIMLRGLQPSVKHAAVLHIDADGSLRRQRRLEWQQLSSVKQHLLSDPGRRRHRGHSSSHTISDGWPIELTTGWV